MWLGRKSREPGDNRPWNTQRSVSVMGRLSLRKEALSFLRCEGRCPWVCFGHGNMTIEQSQQSVSQKFGWKYFYCIAFLSFFFFFLLEWFQGLPALKGERLYFIQCYSSAKLLTGVLYIVGAQTFEVDNMCGGVLNCGVPIFLSAGSNKSPVVYLATLPAGLFASIDLQFY